MAIRVPCPACRRKLKVPEDLAGRRVTCPRCNKVLEVPIPEKSPEEVPDPASTPEHEPQPYVPLPLATRFGIAAVALGLLAILILCLPLVGTLSPGLSGLGLMCGLSGMISSLVRGVRKASGLFPETVPLSFQFGARAVDFSLAGSLVCLLAL